MYLRVAFVCWMVANLCLQISLAPAAKMWTATGVFLLAASFNWLGYSPTLRRVHPVFRYGDRELVLHLGLTFYACVAAGIPACLCDMAAVGLKILVFITGTASLLIGVILFFLDLHHPTVAASFFGLDPLIGYEECYYRKCHLIN